jgi:hypothetical protein
VASASVNTAQQLGGSVGVALLNTLAASAVSGYVASHISPATLVHGRPSPALVSQALIHGYTTAFWWSAAIFASGAVIAGTLFRWGPLTRPGTPTQPNAQEEAPQAVAPPA